MRTWPLRQRSSRLEGRALRSSVSQHDRLSHSGKTGLWWWRLRWASETRRNLIATTAKGSSVMSNLNRCTFHHQPTLLVVPLCASVLTKRLHAALRVLTALPAAAGRSDAMAAIGGSKTHLAARVADVRGLLSTLEVDAMEATRRRRAVTSTVLRYMKEKQTDWPKEPGRSEV